MNSAGGRLRWDFLDDFSWSGGQAFWGERPQKSSVFLFASYQKCKPSAWGIAAAVTLMPLTSRQLALSLLPLSCALWNDVTGCSSHVRRGKSVTLHPEGEASTQIPWDPAALTMSPSPSVVYLFSHLFTSAKLLIFVIRSLITQNYFVSQVVPALVIHWILGPCDTCLCLFDLILGGASLHSATTRCFWFSTHICCSTHLKILN